MQIRFGFLAEDISRRQAELWPLVAGMTPWTARTPIAAFIKSMISARTLDAVSLDAFNRLRARYGSVGRLAEAAPQAVERVIADVTFAGDKARHLIEAVRRIGEHFGSFRLEPLGEMPVPQALTLLERLPGVGRKVAASTLNASTLAMPVMIVDTHTLRVLRRTGLVAANADYRAASVAITEAMTGRWDGAGFLLFHAMLKRLGQQICRHEQPECAACPMAGDCPTARRSLSGDGVESSH
jgi:endonuclease III